VKATRVRVRRRNHVLRLHGPRTRDHAEPPRQGRCARGVGAADVPGVRARRGRLRGHPREVAEDVRRDLRRR
jgi:hypothetical protein